MSILLESGGLILLEDGGTLLLESDDDTTTPPTPIPTPVPVPMPVWTFRALTVGGAVTGDLTIATARKISWDLDAPATASFQLPGRHEQAGLIEELLTDLVVLRDRTPLFRGRVGATSDELEADHQVDFAAVDYRGMLERRILYATQTFTTEDQIDIAWDLIDYTQGAAGGDMGITRDAPTSGITRDRTYDPGSYIGPLLDDLGHLIDGFDWEIGPDLVFRTWYPTRGTARDLALTWPGTLAKVRRQVDPSTYANSVRASGADTTTPTTAGAPDLATRPEGRFDLQVGDPDIIEDATLASKATGVLAQSEDIEPGYTFTLKPGVWQPSDLWLGDTTRVVIRSLPRLDVNTFQRVRKITVSLDDTGNETVEIETGAIQRTLAQRLHATDTRLAALERR